MENILVVVDMQNDFVDGALGTKEAKSIVENVAKKIKDFDGQIYVTYDTHFNDYINTLEGKHLPTPHCIVGTNGWSINQNVGNALKGKDYIGVNKYTFGAANLPEKIKCNLDEDDDFTIELIGLCTDICVISNALILKANFPDNEIFVDASCCAGVTPESHKAALTTMKMCQINVIGEEQ